MQIDLQNEQGESLLDTNTQCLCGDDEYFGNPHPLNGHLATIHPYPQVRRMVISGISAVEVRRFGRILYYWAEGVRYDGVETSNLAVTASNGLREALDKIGLSV